MPINMQGTWYVRVKSKSAASQQRFVIQGATTGNGTYSGVTTTPEVMVTGSNWIIQIQANPALSYVNSDMRIKFPKIVGGWYEFDIESNDMGNDEDFNDLILSCRMPVTDQDYLVYGHVSYYDGCLINPCSFPVIVIDSFTNLKNVYVNESIRKLVDLYYPERVKEILSGPQPEPPDEPFVPMIIPLSGETAIPEKEEIVATSIPSEFSSGKKEEEKLTYNALRNVEISKISENTSLSLAASIDKKYLMDAARVAGRFKLYCESGPIPGALLKFYEYDRSAVELSGAAYQGDGTRDLLGSLAADMNGNYILHFQHTVSDVINEIDTDVATGETSSSQVRPDVLVRLMDQFDPGTYLFETAPKWNIPFLKQINICVPKSKAGIIPTACMGQHIIQGIGNIFVGPPDVSGNRVNTNNYLNSIGLITAYDELAPSVRCAAWTGNLILRGCLKNNSIKYYTIKSRKGLFGSWSTFTQTLRLPKFSGSNLVNTTFGPPEAPIEGYLNVENDTGDWYVSAKNIKALIRTGAFDNGIHQFMIEGYDSSGNKLSGIEETITLYLNNRLTSVKVDPEVTMAGMTQGNCALFTLPVDSSNNVIEDAPMTIRFKVEHNPGGGGIGFINEYQLWMSKGATGNYALNVPKVAANFVSAGQLDNVINRGRYYVHTNNLTCNIQFKGTVNELSADPSGYYTVSVHPSTGYWLEPGQNFCAFSINLDGTLRLTDGSSSGYPDFHATRILIGIERPEETA